LTILIVGGRELELELKDLAAGRVLSPAIKQFEQSVVHPDARPYFLVDSDSFWRCCSLLVLPHSFRKKPVLRQGAPRITLWLIHLLWVRHVHRSREIVSFVNQYPAILLHPIGVWSPSTRTAQNHGMESKKPFDQLEDPHKKAQDAIDHAREVREQKIADHKKTVSEPHLIADGVPKDYTQAAFWVRKAAEQGVAVAQNNLAGLYRDGQGVSKDYVQAASWYRKAAEQGVAEAQSNLGAAYRFGYLQQ